MVTLKAIDAYLVVTIGPTSCLLLYTDVDGIFLLSSDRAGRIFDILVEDLVSARFALAGGDSVSMGRVPTAVYSRMSCELV